MHFALSDNELDSIACSFLNTSESYITVNLPVELNGYADQNYRFRLKADSSQTTAIVNKHYQPLEEFYEIKKGDVSRETSPSHVDQLRQSASSPVYLLFSDIFSASF